MASVEHEAPKRTRSRSNALENGEDVSSKGQSSLSSRPYASYYASRSSSAPDAPARTESHCSPLAHSNLPRAGGTYQYPQALDPTESQYGSSLRNQEHCRMTPNRQSSCEPGGRQLTWFILIPRQRNLNCRRIDVQG